MRETILIIIGFLFLQLILLHIWTMIGDALDQNDLDDWELELEEEDDDQLV